MESFGYMKWGDGPGGHWKSRVFFLALAVLAGTVLWALILSVFLSHASTEREELFRHLEELSANGQTVQGQLQSALRELAATQTKLLQQESALKELTTSVTQDAAKANRDRENIRNELYRALQNVQLQNGSCEPCPESWRVFEGSCYFFSEKRASWQEAQQQCAQASAHLVVIGGMEEQSFLNRNIQRDHGYWLGLRAVRLLGRVVHYQWVDGAILGFSYWNFGEPNDSRRAEDCVMMLDSGMWNDAPCRNERDHWICEKRRSC